MHKVHQLLGRLHHLHSTKVDTTEYDMVVLRGFDVGLQWGLPIQFDGQVDDAAALHQTIRRCIRPSACDIYPDRRTSPDYLVVSDTEGRFFC